MFNDCVSMLFCGNSIRSHFPVRFFAFLTQADVSQFTLGGFLWVFIWHHRKLLSSVLLNKSDPVSLRPIYQYMVAHSMSLLASQADS